MAAGDEHRHAADERERQAAAARPAQHSETATRVPCGSPMCSDPHWAIYGRCACVKPKGHDGLHSCGEDFWLSERPVVSERPRRRVAEDLWTGIDALEGWLQDRAAFIPWFFFLVGLAVGWFL